MINKSIVARNFSKSSKTYNKYAKVQKHMAKKVMGFVSQDKDNLKILEIGSGTGYLTELLLKRFPESQVEVCDISREMLKGLEEKYGKKIKSYILADVEEHDFYGKYDLIVSNATFQWFNDIEGTVKKLKDMLKEEGQLLFSTFGKETYRELSQSFTRIGEGYSYSQDFCSKEYFEQMGLLLEEETYMEEYESLVAFLKSIKGVGATSAREGKKVVTKGVLRKVEEEYRSLCRGKVEVTNHLLYIRNK